MDVHTTVGGFGQRRLLDFHNLLWVMLRLLLNWFVSLGLFWWRCTTRGWWLVLLDGLLPLLIVGLVSVLIEFVVRFLGSGWVLRLLNGSTFERESVTRTCSMVVFIVDVFSNFLDLSIVFVIWMAHCPPFLLDNLIDGSYWQRRMSLGQAVVSFFMVVEIRRILQYKELRLRMVLQEPSPFNSNLF